MRRNAPPLSGALIGCGYVSRFHLEAWSRVPGGRLVAVCDLNRQRADKAAGRVAGVKAYIDAAELLAKEADLDFVEICTPPESHRELVDLAAGRGLHILCQKPAALERQDHCAMIETCAAAGVRLMIHENWRYRPWYRAMRDGLGDPRPVWRWERRRGCGDAGCFVRRWWARIA
jgi:predicted dehydrogenase